MSHTFYYKKYTKYKHKYLNEKYKQQLGGNHNSIFIDKYLLIGIGDFSHGDNNIWIYRLNLLKEVINNTDKQIYIFTEDTIEHTQNILQDKKIILENKYDVIDNRFAYGPLDRYCFRAFDSPIFLKIIKYIRKFSERIKIVGVDNANQERDKQMSKIILNNIDEKNINFFWAANAHIDSREIKESYELKWVPNEKYRAGYYLRKQLGNKYCIILSTGYKGTLRFGSKCNNMDCDVRSFFKIPIFKKVIHDMYEKYKTNNEFDIYTRDQFVDNIIEYTDAIFPIKYFSILSNEWNYLLFFTKIKKLNLMQV